MKWAVLATWKMAENGTAAAADILAKGGTCGDAAVAGISDVEDNPNFHSVGLGGRPARDGRIYLDGSFMDGNTLHYGAVGAIEGFRSPVRIARSLIDRKANNFLVGKGAEEYARANGFEERNNLTAEATEIYEQEKEKQKELSAYDGHDTVCFLAKDMHNSLCVGTSTSGLFMKDPGRLGDTPVIGSGFYADSEIGAAAATGMGEEIMKGVLSYQAVVYLKAGMTAQEAAEKAVNETDASLRKRNGYADAMSLIVIDKDGNWGVGTNVEFTFAYASDEKKPTVYRAVIQDGRTVFTEI